MSTQTHGMYKNCYSFLLVLPKKVIKSGLIQFLINVWLMLKFRHLLASKLGLHDIFLRMLIIVKEMMDKTHCRCVCFYMYKLLSTFNVTSWFRHATYRYGTQNRDLSSEIIHGLSTKYILRNWVKTFDDKNLHIENICNKPEPEYALYIYIYIYIIRNKVYWVYLGDGNYRWRTLSVCTCIWLLELIHHEMNKNIWFEMRYRWGRNLSILNWSMNKKYFAYHAWTDMHIMFHTRILITCRWNANNCDYHNIGHKLSYIIEFFGPKFRVLLLIFNVIW